MALLSGSVFEDNMDPKWHKLYYKHTQRAWSILLPWFYREPTALYYLDRLRYAAYLENDYERNTGYINWHRRKQTIQQEYQRKCEREGAILRDIFVNRFADETSRAVDYLNWLGWTWLLYEKNLKRSDFQDEGFVRFCQSDLILDEELTETWKFK